MTEVKPCPLCEVIPKVETFHQKTGPPVYFLTDITHPPLGKSTSEGMFCPLSVHLRLGMDMATAAWCEEEAIRKWNSYYELLPGNDKSIEKQVILTMPIRSLPTDVIESTLQRRLASAGYKDLAEAFNAPHDEIMLIKGLGKILLRKFKELKSKYQ